MLAGANRIKLHFFLVFLHPSPVSCTGLSFTLSPSLSFPSFLGFLSMSSSASPYPSHSYFSAHPLSLSLPSSFPLSSSSQWFSPLSCHQLLGPGLLRLGRLWLRSPSHATLAPGLWMSGFGLLRGDHLFLCPASGPGPPAPEDMVHLRRLQEISEQGWGMDEGWL